MGTRLKFCTQGRTSTVDKWQAIIIEVLFAISLATIYKRYPNTKLKSALFNKKFAATLSKARASRFSPQHCNRHKEILKTKLKSALFNHYIVLQLKSFSRRRTPTFLLKG
jgi:hypothetical protein